MSSEVLIRSNSMLANAEQEKEKDFRGFLGTSNTVIHHTIYATLYRFFEGVRGVMVTVVVNEHCDSSSTPRRSRLRFSLKLWINSRADSAL